MLRDVSRVCKFVLLDGGGERRTNDAAFLVRWHSALTKGFQVRSDSRSLRQSPVAIDGSLNILHL